MMPSNGIENPDRLRPALLASGFRRPVDSTGVPTPDLRGVEGRGAKGANDAE
jgi:hypothetical protein